MNDRSPKIKKEMDRLKYEINWDEERNKRKVLQEVTSYIQTLPESPKGLAQKLVREVRDSH